MSNIQVVSPTLIDTIRTCPLKARYRYVERLPEMRKSGALVLGIAVDTAAKHIVHAIRAGEIRHGAIDAGEILRWAWDQELSHAGGVEIVWGERGSEEKARTTAVALLEAFAKLPDLPQRIERIESVDVRFEIPIPDPATGRDLAVFERRDPEFLAVDVDIGAGRLRAYGQPTKAGFVGDTQVDCNKRRTTHQQQRNDRKNYPSHLCSSVAKVRRRPKRPSPRLPHYSSPHTSPRP